MEDVTYGMLTINIDLYSDGLLARARGTRTVVLVYLKMERRIR